MLPGRLSRALAALSVAFSVLTTHEAFADDPAAAEALFAEAKTLMKDGRFAEACPKLEASLKLDRTMGTLMNLADCHEKVGKIASAWAEWGAALELLSRAGDAREAFAKERQAALAGRLPKLRIEVRSPRPGLDVLRDGIKLEPGAYDAALPVDPGEHVVSVRRGEQVISEQKVVAAEAKTETVTLDLEAIERAAPAPPPTATATAGLPPPHPPPSTQKTIGFVVGGVGLAAIAVAAGFEIAALVNVGNAEEPDGCVNQYCGPGGFDSVERARTFADVGQWVGIGGLLVTSIGVVLVATAPSAPAAPTEKAARRTLAPWIGPSAGGVSFAGSL